MSEIIVWVVALVGVFTVAFVFLVVGFGIGRRHVLDSLHKALTRSEWDGLLDYPEVRRHLRRVMRRVEAMQGTPPDDRTYMVGDFSAFETHEGMSKGLLRGPAWGELHDRRIRQETHQLPKQATE